jgi:hypothetical protein
MYLKAPPAVPKRCRYHEASQGATMRHSVPQGTAKCHKDSHRGTAVPQRSHEVPQRSASTGTAIPDWHHKVPPAAPQRHHEARRDTANTAVRILKVPQSTTSCSNAAQGTTTVPHKEPRGTRKRPRWNYICSTRCHNAPDAPPSPQDATSSAATDRRITQGSARHHEHRPNGTAR